MFTPEPRHWDTTPVRRNIKSCTVVGSGAWPVATGLLQVPLHSVQAHPEKLISLDTVLDDYSPKHVQHVACISGVGV